MEKTFAPQEIETKWYKTWEERGYFAPDDSRKERDDAYSIVIPPPNVTGSLHIGHALQHGIMDALTRYNRMKGKNALWQVGTDHAGIATQMVVERKLAAEGQPGREELGREKFIEKIWDWKEESGGTITKQMRRLGNSVDWETERFTMDDGFYKGVQEAFVRLHADGLIYRGKRWSTGIQSCTPPSPISKLKTAKSKARCGICATRWLTVKLPTMAKTTLSSPPPARKLCSVIPA